MENSVWNTWLKWRHCFGIVPSSECFSPGGWGALPYIGYILGFHQPVIKTKNRNHSMNKIKNLEYDRWLIHKQPRANNQVSAVFHSGVICGSVSPKLIELCMETPCLCPSEGHRHGGPKVTQTPVTEFCYWNEKLLRWSSETLKEMFLLVQALFSQQKLNR